MNHSPYYQPRRHSPPAHTLKLALACCECGRVQNEPTRRCTECNAPVQRQRVAETAERAA